MVYMKSLYRCQSFIIKEQDLVEEHEGKLYGFEFKWGGKKRKGRGKY